jgi:ribosomal protein L37E
MLLMSNWPHTLSPERVGVKLSLSLSQKYDLLSQNYDLLEHKKKVYSESSRRCTRIGAAKAYSVSSKSCTQIGAQGLIRLRSMIYSNKVYITKSSGVCQAQTQIQEQCVLGSNEKCAALRFKHNVYSDLDWSSRV